jgi:hypothetical protein
MGDLMLAGFLGRSAKYGAIALLPVFIAASAVAEKVNGPAIYYDRSATLEAESSDAGSHFVKGISRNYIEAFALFPLKARSLNFMLVPTMKYVESHRKIEFHDGTTSNSTWPLLVPGVIVVPDFRPFDLRLFVVANRYGSPDFATSPRHMAEYIVGTDFDGFLLQIKPEFLTVLKSRLIYRLRDFPDRRTYLTVFYLDVESNHGAYISAGYPSHFRLGWKTGDESHNIFVEIMGESRSWPVSIQSLSYWVDGNTIDRALGYKFAVVEPLYIEIRGGLKTENLGFYDSNGKKQWEFESKSALFGSIALKTMFFQ